MEWTLTAIAISCYGAVGKSAQIPLYVWLPDAMEGPTPVSALIHPHHGDGWRYLVARSSLLFAHAPLALEIVGGIGCLTALFAATIALTQNDLKRLLAYSTISQLGYMFVGCGVECLPPASSLDDARFLQVTALPRRRQRHACSERRARHAKDGRVAPQDEHDLLDIPHRHARHKRRARAFRVLQ